MTDPAREAELPDSAPLLVAARDDSMRRFVTLLLRGTRARLVMAETQEAVLGALKEGEFAVAVVVSDVNGWPGREVAHALREACATSNTWTVFLGHEPPDGPWHFVERFLSLPFASNELVEVVSGLLAGRSRGLSPY